jgi:hypothetical protein
VHVDVGRLIALTRGGGRWLTSGPSATSYIIKDFQMSKFEI